MKTNADNSIEDRLIAGPPWVAYPNTTPDWDGWHQGDAQRWLRSVFLPRWQKMSARQRKRYLQDQLPPTDEWRIQLERWADAKPDSPFDFSLSPEPPWQCYPGKPSWWAGWKQGDIWLDSVFFPFWNALTRDQRDRYLEQWLPPDDDWRETMQQWRDGPTIPLTPPSDFTDAPEPPWQRYPGKAPGWKGLWIGEQKKWLEDVFLPFWATLTTMQRDQYIAEHQVPDNAWIAYLYRKA
jgi:hypothetical protein